MADDDRLAAALTEERAILAAAAYAADRRAWRIATQVYGTLKVHALLAAVEAVLKLTGPDGEVHRDLDGNEEKGLVRVVRCDALREAITAALAGEEAGGGG